MKFDFLAQHTIAQLLEIIPTIANRVKNNFLCVPGKDGWMITISRGHATSVIHRALDSLEKRGKK